ncbi:MAG TPA: hypothetical protein P5096_02130 [Patescibacteria group bacterium]|nr:hypothetical protein [Patescibacteria group bacterium]
MKKISISALFFMFKYLFKIVVEKKQNFRSMQLNDLSEYEKLKEEMEDVEKELVSRLRILDAQTPENFDGFTISELRKKYDEQNAIITSLAYMKDKESFAKMRTAQLVAEKLREVIIERMGKGERQ